MLLLSNYNKDDVNNDDYKLFNNNDAATGVVNALLLKDKNVKYISSSLLNVIDIY